MFGSKHQGKSEKCLWNLCGHLLLGDNWFTKWMDPFFGTEEVDKLEFCICDEPGPINADNIFQLQDG